MVDYLLVLCAKTVLFHSGFKLWSEVANQTLDLMNISN